MTLIILTCITTFLFSLFSTGIMSYIALATPIGPWVAPMLALIGIMIFSVVVRNHAARQRAIDFSVMGGSVGGILAVAIGSSYPTLYFLDAQRFNDWMAQPLYFAFLMTLTALTAGLYGFILANIFEKQLLFKQNLPFPIGQLVYNMVTAAQGQIHKALELVSGFVGTIIFSFLQGGMLGIRGIIPPVITLVKARTVSIVNLPLIQLRLDTFPMLWAIGFIAGTTIAIPLAVGALSKIILLDPLNDCLFPQVCNSDFSIAFCSGLLAMSSLLGFASLPKFLKNIAQRSSGTYSIDWRYYSREYSLDSFSLVLLVPLAALMYLFFTLFNFTFLQALYLLIGALITTYSMTSIAGKIGLAQLGRFATFVMVPSLFLFGINPVHAMLIATFVEISGGVATDILFGRRLAHLSNLSRTTTMLWQLFGLVTSCCVVGFFFWLLINHFGLGSTALFAQRAQARALLINIRTFNVYVLMLGAAYGLLLKKLKLNPMLVFGGLLMPLTYSLGLILGGFSTLLVKNRQSWEPFCSGVFAANSLTEFLKVLR